jgi:hypothetical protein
MEQMFIISHNISPGQYDNIVHVLNITGEEWFIDYYKLNGKEVFVWVLLFLKV